MKGRKPNLNHPTGNAGSFPATPKGLSEAEAERWCFWRKTLRHSGIASGIDATLLLSLCRAEVLASEAAEALRQVGGPFYAAASGLQKVHPAVAVLRDASNAIRQLLAELNLTPARRGAKPTVEREPSAFERMFPRRDPGFQ